MENDKLKKRKVILSNSILPYFKGISGDLMFFIAINTLFLTEVKGLSTAEISFLSTITYLTYMLLQPFALKIIQKIGNVRAIRLGTIMLLSSSVLITFGNHYFVIMLGYMLYQPSFILKKMDDVVLESNLHYLNRQGDYIKLANKANIIYSVITMVIALVAGKIFTLNHYLPMYLCISICVINFLMSFCIFDVGNTSFNHAEEKGKRIKFSKLVLTIFLSFALLYAIMNIGQNQSQLFIQYNLQDHFNLTLTATYFSIILVTSRVTRILGNLVFKKIYVRYQDKVSLLLSSIAIIAFAIILMGSCFNFAILVKFILMTIGFDLILAIRDPFEAYSTDLVLKNTKEEEQQKAISYLQLARRTCEFMINLIFSMLLIKIPLFYIIVCLMLLAILSLGVNRKLYKMIQK